MMIIKEKNIDGGVRAHVIAGIYIYIYI